MAKTLGINKDKTRGTFTVQKQYKGITIKKRGFISLNEAKAFLAEEMYKIDNPVDETIKKDITLDELYANYYNYRKTNVRITSLYGDNQKYQNHISPVLGNILLSKLSSNDIATWKLKLVKKEMTERFTNQVICILRSLLRYGLERDYHISNKLLIELTKVKMKKKVVEREILTYDEIDKFLETFNKDIPKEYAYWLYFYTLSRCGMRPNEFRALQVKDIKGNYLSVNHDITSKIKGQGDIIQYCKNDSSIREVLMPEDIINLLNEYTKDYDPNDFIFGKEKPFRETNIKRMLDKHLKIANLKHITVYGFRHSHATHLIRNGVMIKVVSTRLGHKDIQTTLNVYQHLLKEDQESVLKLL